MNRLLSPLLDRLPLPLRSTLELRLLAGLHIPMLAFASPRILHLDEHSLEAMIPLTWRTRNHLGCMYFAALAAGADCAAGLLALHLCRSRAPGTSIIFKSFSANFLRRSEGDVLFLCSAGQAIAAAIDELVQSGKRVNLPVEVLASVPSKGPEPTARFVLELSLKGKG